MTAEELRAQIVYHRTEAKGYQRAASRIGGDLGAASRSYANHHNAKARELEAELEALEGKTA